MVRNNESSAFSVAIEAADEGKHHHLVLLGTAINYALDSTGIDWNLFKLQRLNYLSMTQSKLAAFPPDVELLTNLTTLILHSNKMTDISSSIEKLINLKVLDCSRNRLMFCPNELGELPQLRVLNLASNHLTSLPMLTNPALTVLNLESNQLEDFPNFCELKYLSELNVSDNKISSIPPTISRLQALRVLNIKYNLLKDLPDELASCEKLEELNAQWNKMDNDYLYYLCSSVSNTKKIIQYLKSPASSEARLIVSKFKKRDINLFVSRTNPLYIVRHIIEVQGVTDGIGVIKVTEHVDGVRPFIAACIIKGIKFTEENFKKFIQLQIKTGSKTYGNKFRTILTTHDMKFITPGDLTYTAKPPTDLNIIPHLRQTTHTGELLYNELLAEKKNINELAEGKQIERYESLQLLKDKSLFPCLLDNSQQVISFPPIINSDRTKISSSTQTMFVEATSITSHGACRYLLDEFLEGLLISGITNPTMDAEGRYRMIVEQVKVEDIHGNLKLIYPSRCDFRTVVFNEKAPVDIKRGIEIP